MRLALDPAGARLVVNELLTITLQHCRNLQNCSHHPPSKATPPAEDIPIYNGRGCTLLELSQGKCRWPISNPGAEDFCFCGNEPVKGLPYCLGHARIAYRSVGRQRSSRRETR